jgi:hypothetical protein
VVFGRINRRRTTQDTLAMRTFADDMRELAESRLTRFEETGTTNKPSRTWVAADMTLDASGDFMTGTLGYSLVEERRSFDNEAWSWVKGQTEVSDTASENTVVPFAVDLREDQRWVAFATTNRLQPAGFAYGLERVLNQAVSDAGLIPTEWEVDLVAARARIEEWLRENPLVHMLRRTVKFTNPGRDLDEDRREMQALGARRKTEEFKAPPNATLDTSSPQFNNKLDGTETGDLELLIKSRGHQGVRDVTFSTTSAADLSVVADFERDLMRGMEIVLAALREYVMNKRRIQDLDDHGSRPDEGGLLDGS